VKTNPALTAHRTAELRKELASIPRARGGARSRGGSSVPVADAQIASGAIGVLLSHGLYEQAQDRIAAFRTAHEQPAADEPFEDLPLAQLCLTVRTLEQLDALGYHRVADLLRVTPIEVLNLRNIGRKTVEEIRLALLRATDMDCWQDGKTASLLGPWTAKIK